MPGLARRQFLATVTCGTASQTLAKEPAPPNLLFVLADQWRGSAFGFGSDLVVRTPHFDRLAQQGANWRRAYAANPVCTPNRACILTGRYSHQTGMIRNSLQLPPGEVCWPESLRDAGYSTHYVGKWHLDGPAKPGFVPPGWQRRGFQTFEGFNRGHVYHEPWGFDDHGNPLKDRAAAMPDPYYEPALQTDLAIDFMRRHSAKPFACYLSWGPPHTPFRPPQSYRHYKRDEIVLRGNVPEEHHGQARKDLVGYYGLCESLDHEMGRVMEFLDETGLSSNTLVIFSSDHGELAGSHGKYRKGEPEDESLRVPLLMRLPGRIPAGIEPQTLISSVDLMPTLLSLCELSSSETCAGLDLSGAVLPDRDTPAVQSVYCEGKVSNTRDAPSEPNSKALGPWRAIVTERYKLNVRVDHANVESLFDLREDPLELRNLVGEPRVRSVQSDLLAELKDWGVTSGDSFPLKPSEARPQYPAEQE